MERWQGRIIAVWMMIRQQIVYIICVSGLQTCRAEAEKEAFREEVDMLAGLSDGQTMLCVAGDFNAQIGVVEPGDEEGIGRVEWGTRHMEGRELVVMLRRNGLAVAGTFFQKKDSYTINYRSDTRQISTYRWCGVISSWGLRTAKRWRESLAPHNTNRLSLRSA